jgi:hypothetical protein
MFSGNRRASILLQRCAEEALSNGSAILLRGSLDGDDTYHIAGAGAVLTRLAAAAHPYFVQVPSLGQAPTCKIFFGAIPEELSTEADLDRVPERVDTPFGQVIVQFQSGTLYQVLIWNDIGTIVLAPARDGPPPWLVLLRVLRNQFTLRAMRQGAVLLHASAVVSQDTACLFVGSKAAGKTTLMLDALECGAAFLSNDRVLIDPHGMAFGVPTAIGIRSDTLRRHPTLQQYRGRPSQNWHRPNEPSNSGRLTLEVADVAHAFGVSIAPRARARAIALLDRHDRAEAGSLSALLSESADTIVPHVQSEVDDNQPFWGRGTSAETAASLFHQLEASLDIWRLKYGNGADGVYQTFIQHLQADK